MSEDKFYKDGDIVWVKLGNNWWPGEVAGPNRHPEGLIKHLKRVPYCVVKFFNENAYEYVRSSKQIFPFQCTKQEEFIRKGYSLYNSGNTFMEKFPSDVEVAKRLTRRKEASVIINDRPDSIVKAILSQPLIRTYDECNDGSEYLEKRRSSDYVTKILNITANRNDDPLSSEKHGIQTSTMSNLPNNKTKNIANIATNNSSNYQCDLCDFTSVRQNVMIFHLKMHNNRNSLDSNNTTTSSTPTTTNTKSTTATVRTTITTSTNVNINEKQTHQNQIINKDKTISKNKVSTITTATKATARTTKRSTPVVEKATDVPASKALIDAPETEIRTKTPKEKHNNNTKIQTPPSVEKSMKLKTSKTPALKDMKEDSAYAAILSDFCPSDTETLPSTEENQSRRSLRNCKNVNETATGKVNAICIDLLETKTIQKIPKKRGYSTLQLENESTAEATADADVVCLADKAVESTTSSLSHSNKPKKDAEDIRKMLLADWSDDDEIPNDVIIVDDSIVVENADSNECISEQPMSEQGTSAAIVLTSTPLVKSVSASTSRIRNIPKKDRRDVVLQDFNSDLSLIPGGKIDHATKSMSVDLDSSSSSVVEIIEDDQPAAIITINDDEEQDISKAQKSNNDIVSSESKDNDSTVGPVNDKSASAATSTTSLSCFDFQEDEDEQEPTTTTISHFKKKYLSVEKLQSLTTCNADELRDDVAVKHRAELADKDQRLAAEIETLLEQTRPPVADLLNANSLEECMSVKDLPIKERGKRIFKSRNKTRMEDKPNATDAVSVTAVVPSLISAANTEHYKSLENLTRIEQHKNMESCTTTEKIITNDNDKNESNLQQKDENELNLEQKGESLIDKERILTTDDHLTNPKVLIDISSQEIVHDTQAELPKYSKENPLTTNENKENENLIRGNKDASEVFNGDRNTSEVQKNQDNVITFDSLEYNANEDEAIQNLNTKHDDNDNSSNQLVYNHEVAPKLKQLVKNVTAENAPEQENLIKGNNENIVQIENISEVELNKEVKKSDKNFAEASENKKEETQISKLTQKNFEDNSSKGSILEISELPQKSIGNVFRDDMELIPFENESNDADKKVIQLQSSENIFKLRVKSPDQILDQAFVGTSQHEQELSTTIDGNADTRLITTTPTDENSSMGASDTGAEFGSPTSMLSEERLPTFRFQNNQTPQQEIETIEAELPEENSQEKVHEDINLGVDKSELNSGVKENLLKCLPQIFGKSDQKSCQQRRFSMDLYPVQAESKSFKRTRFSVDDNITNLQNSLEKTDKNLDALKLPQTKAEWKIRPKSRHVKITPRRNVSELFKSSETKDSHVSKDIEKCISLESVKEGQCTKELVTIIDKSLEKQKQIEELIQNNENSETILEENSNTKHKQVEHNHKENIVGNIVTEANNLSSSADTEENKEINEDEEKDSEYKLNSAYEPKTVSEELKSTKNVFIEAQNSNNSVTINNPTNETTTEKASSDNQNTEIETKSIVFAEKDISNLDVSKTDVMEDQFLHTFNIMKSTTANDISNKDITKNSDSVETPIITVESVEDAQNRISCSSIILSLDKGETHNDQVLEIPYSPGVPPPTPQEREVVIESENLNQSLNTQQQRNFETETETTFHSQIPKRLEKLNELTNQIVIPQETPLNVVTDHHTILKENVTINEEVVRTIIPTEKEHINGEEIVRCATPQVTDLIDECKTAETSPAEKSLDITVRLFENNIIMPCTSQEISVDDICENPIKMPLTPLAKDLIIECEPSTPQGIIEYDHNIPAQITPEKEVIIESDTVMESPPSVTQEKDIIIEENLQLEEKDSLLEREFQVMQPKEMPASGAILQETQSNSLQTDADKAAEEFLLEFDSIVNHSHSVEENVPNSAVEDAINAEDLINNIIEEVHDDNQLKQDAPPTTESPLQFEPVTTYTLVAPKNSWNQIFKESFNKQLPPAKRRQTICFEISDIKEAVACKKQALDFESILPVNKTIKRTAERKLTLPAIETKLSNSRQHNILSFNSSQLTLNKKLIPTTKRKLSIEDNITSFIIERPKQQPANSSSGPPPLQRIRPLSRQNQTNSTAIIDNLSEPPPLQSQDTLFHELFQTDTPSPTPDRELGIKAEGAHVAHQQILNTSAISSIPQNRTSDTKISKNKQIGIDSRGNKYVIIKTPPTDIIIQPTLTSTTSAAITGTNNFGTTVTIQPITRSASEPSVTKTATTTKNKNIDAAAAILSRKQEQQQHQMKQISIAVQAKSSLNITKSPDVAAKTHPRYKRKAAHAKAVAAAATANSSFNSPKHRQAVEALSRRLSIASETPPLAKISRTSSTHVQTQITKSSSNLTFFADAQISNIAQQQLMQLQQQQQQTQASSSLPPPIILNKNAHQQSVIQRKARKIPQQIKQNHQQQAAAAAKSSQLLQQLQLQQQQHQDQLQQHQEIQQQFITQITPQQPQQQQHNTIQPPPLQHIQQQTIPVQQHQQQIVQQSDGIIITTSATEDDNVIDSNTQLIALPTQPYPGYSETFLLCKVKGNTCKPVDNVPLYLNHQLNELVPVPLEALEGGLKPQEHQIEVKATNATQQLLADRSNVVQDNEGNIQMSNLNCNLVDGDISASIEAEHHLHHHSQQQIMEESEVDNGEGIGNNQINNFGGNQDVNSELVTNNGILLNIEGQQVLLDVATFAHLLANPDANTQLISDDGTEYVLTHEVLAALQMQQEQQALELANAVSADQQQHQQDLEPTEGNDIIAVALAGSELCDNDVLTIDTSQAMHLIDGDGSIVFPAQTGAITQQHLTPPAVVTNAVLDQSPIMSTLEVPSSIATSHKLQGTQLITVPSHHLTSSANAALGVGGRSNLEDSLAAIGVTTQSSSIPSSLGLPITVTNPNIASKVTSAGPLNEMLQFVSHRPTTAAATAAAVAAAALAGETRIFAD